MSATAGAGGKASGSCIAGGTQPCPFAAHTSISPALFAAVAAYPFLSEIRGARSTYGAVGRHLANGKASFVATGTRPLFATSIAYHIFEPTRQPVHLPTLAAGLVFELPCIAGNTVAFTLKDSMVVLYLFATLAAFFHDALAL